MIAWGLLAAAGAGARLGERDGVPKALRPVGGTEMFLRGLDVLDASSGIEGIVVVVPDLWGGHVLERLPGRFKKTVEMVGGGPTRQASVRAGLAAIPPDADAVVVHDAARPLATPALVERVLGGLGSADGAVCAVPVSDTLKRVDDGAVVETVERSGLWRVQTPQAFRLDPLRAAHEAAARDGVDATDDAALVERAGGTVVVVQGDERNIKITTPEDFAIAEALLAQEENGR